MSKLTWVVINKTSGRVVLETTDMTRAERVIANALTCCTVMTFGQYRHNIKVGHAITNIFSHLYSAKDQ